MQSTERQNSSLGEIKKKSFCNKLSLCLFMSYIFCEFVIFLAKCGVGFARPNFSLDSVNELFSNS